VAVYVVLFAKVELGVSVANSVDVLYVTAPATRPEGPCSDMLAVVIVAGSIALLKAAVAVVPGATPVAPLAGVTEVTVGGVGPVLPEVLNTTSTQ
jgi:hypothetical protein